MTNWVERYEALQAENQKLAERIEELETTMSGHEFRHGGMTLPFTDPRCDVCGVKRSVHVKKAVVAEYETGSRRDSDYGATITSAWVLTETEEGAELTPAESQPSSYSPPQLLSTLPAPIWPDLTSASDSLAQTLNSASEAIAHPDVAPSSSGGGSGGFDSTPAPSYDPPSTDPSAPS